MADELSKKQLLFLTENTPTTSKEKPPMSEGFKAITAINFFILKLLNVIDVSVHY